MVGYELLNLPYASYFTLKTLSMSSFHGYHGAKNLNSVYTCYSHYLPDVHILILNLTNNSYPRDRVVFINQYDSKDHEVDLWEI